jgi:hypothetical protein
MLDAVDDGLLELFVIRHNCNFVMLPPLTLMQQESSSLVFGVRPDPLSSVLESGCPKTTRSARCDEMLEASLFVPILNFSFAFFL